MTLRIVGDSDLEWKCSSCQTWNNECRESCRQEGCVEKRPQELTTMLQSQEWVYDQFIPRA